MFGSTVVNNSTTPTSWLAVVVMERSWMDDDEEVVSVVIEFVRKSKRLVMVARRECWRAQATYISKFF